MMRFARWSLTLLAIVGSIAELGCNSRGATPVKGVVLLDGKPVAGATVSFVPTEGTGRPAGATTDAQGNFALTTFEAGDGALEGVYRVLVTKVAPTDPPEPPAPTAPEDDDRIEERYEQYWQERRSAQRTELPTVYARADSTPLTCTVPTKGPVVLELRSDAE